MLASVIQTSEKYLILSMSALFISYAVTWEIKSRCWKRQSSICWSDHLIYTLSSGLQNLYIKCLNLKGEDCETLLLWVLSYIMKGVGGRENSESERMPNGCHLSRFSLDLSVTHVYKIVFLYMMTNAQLQSFISLPYVSANE